MIIYLFVCLWNKQPKPNQTQSDKLKQIKPKPIYFVCLFKASIQTKPNQTFSTINSKLSSINKIISKVTEKLIRAVQLLFRPVFVSEFLEHFFFFVS